MVVGLVAEMFAGTGIRDPVTTTSCSVGSGAALVAGACCAAAGIDRAATHIHTDRAMNRFRSDVMPMGFLILPSPEVGYLGAGRSGSTDDNRPPTSQHGNGMNAAGRVMKAAGEWTKCSRALSHLGLVRERLPTERVGGPSILMRDLMGLTTSNLREWWFHHVGGSTHPKVAPPECEAASVGG